MSNCTVCNEYFPPTFTDLTEDKKANICVFCKRGVTKITSRDEKTFAETTVTKTEVINAYKDYIKKMVENPNVRKQMYKDIKEGD